MAHKKIPMERDKKIALSPTITRNATCWNGQSSTAIYWLIIRCMQPARQGRCWKRNLASRSSNSKADPLAATKQLGALIVENKVDFLIFFWDPLEPQPHDPDVKVLLRMAVVWNIPIANNRASADFMISSPLMDKHYDRLVPDYENYTARKINLGEKSN